MRKELKGLDLQRTLIHTPDTPLGVSGMVQRWCWQNDVRFHLDDTKFYDQNKHCYRHSLLRYLDHKQGVAFIGQDKYSAELVKVLESKHYKRPHGPKLISVVQSSAARHTEIVLIEPHQVMQYRALGYHVLYIGLQEYTYQIANSIIPFLPDSRSKEWLLTERVSLNQFEDWYWAKLQQSQVEYPQFWDHLFKRQKYVICNHRDYADYDYSPIFARVMQAYLEQRWMDVVIVDKRKG